MVKSLQILGLLWPGLDTFWRQGSLRGLAKALGFSILLILSLLTVLIWPEWLSPGRRTVVCLCSLGYWSAMVGGDLYLGYFTGKGLTPPAILQAEDSPFCRYEDVLEEYLQGHYSGARQKLSRILDSDSQDTESLLLMATVLRKEGLLEAAKQYLDRAAHSPRGEKWAEEIAEERLWMTADAAEDDDSPRGEMQKRMEAA